MRRFELREALPASAVTVPEIGPGKARLFKIASVLIGLAAGALLAEIGLRLRAAYLDRDPEQELQRTISASPPAVFGDCSHGVPASLGQIVRPSLDHEVVYELKPDVDTCYYGTRVSTNGQGLRASRNYATPKPPGVFRILALGDSQTFGQGVRLEDTYGSVLERKLGALAPGSRVEVVNAGVPGYNTAQEAAFLKRYGLGYQPDCVIVLFIKNDFGVPYLMLERRNALEARGSFLWNALRAATRRAEYLNPEWQVAGGPWAESVPEQDLERVPQAYRHMVGVSGYERALHSLAETARSAGVPLVDFADYTGLVPSVIEDLARLHRSLGVALPAFEYPDKKEQWLDERDCHFNVRGHRSVARRMLRALQQERLCVPPANR